MAETAQTAKLEKRQAGGFGTVRRKEEPIEVNYALGVKLSAVLDLTDPRVIRTLETSKSEIVGPWRFRADDTTPPTHILGGEVVRSKRFSSLRYASAANPRGRCVVVFPDQMQSAERILVLDEDSIVNQMITAARRR
jgi:RES domain-containing protein